MGNLCSSLSKHDRNSVSKELNECEENSMDRMNSKNDFEKLETSTNSNPHPTESVNELKNNTNKEDNLMLETMNVDFAPRKAFKQKYNITRIRYRKVDSRSVLKEQDQTNKPNEENLDVDNETIKIESRNSKNDEEISSNILLERKLDDLICSDSLNHDNSNCEEILNQLDCDLIPDPIQCLGHEIIDKTDNKILNFTDFDDVKDERIIDNFKISPEDSNSNKSDKSDIDNVYNESSKINIDDDLISNTNSKSECLQESLLECPQETNLECLQETHFECPQETHFECPQETHFECPQETHFECPQETHLECLQESLLELEPDKSINIIITETSSKDSNLIENSTNIPNHNEEKIQKEVLKTIEKNLNNITERNFKLNFKKEKKSTIDYKVNEISNSNSNCHKPYKPNILHSQFSDDVISELKQKLEFDKIKSPSEVKQNLENTNLKNNQNSLLNNKTSKTTFTFNNSVKRRVTLDCNLTARKPINDNLKKCFEISEPSSNFSQQKTNFFYTNKNKSDSQQKELSKNNFTHSPNIQKTPQNPQIPIVNCSKEILQALPNSQRNNQSVIIAKSIEILENQTGTHQTKITQNPKSSCNVEKSFSQIFKSQNFYSKSENSMKTKSILPVCDPKCEIVKTPAGNVSIKVTDKLTRKRSVSKNNMPWTLDKEEENLVKRQPYLLKRLNRANKCPVNNDHTDSLSNGITNKIPACDRSAKSITFAETPQYFKLNMAEEVSETEIPNPESIEQSRISPSEKYFDPVALNLCQKKIVTFETLVFQLIHENPSVKTDLDKARAVFTWLTNINATEAHFDYINERKDFKNDEAESPIVYLHGLCTGQYTYAQFFQLLCRFAGIRCKLLRGYAKGNDFKPGMKLEGGKAAQHAWNSVEISGTWYLCDTHWTARRLAGRNSNQGKQNSTQLDLFYFLIHPDDMKYSHFPFDKSWQLVPNPISLETFEKLAIVKPAFFRFELSFHNQFEAIVKTNNDIKIELKFPNNDSTEKITFTYTFQTEGKAVDSFKDIPLSRFGLVEIVKTDETFSIVRFWIRFPESGSYKIMIFAKAVEDQLFSGVCEYYIIADISTEQTEKVKPFPPTQQTCYGKTELLSKYNIKSSWNNEAIKTLESSIFEIQFKSTKKTDCTSCPRLMARLKCNSIDDSELSKKLLIRIIAPTEDKYKSDVSSVEEVHIRGYLPDINEYALEIYANNPETEGSSFFLIWQHLIVCKAILLDQPIPHLSQGFILGAQERFKELGLRALSYPDPLITVNQCPIHPDADVSIKLGLPIVKALNSSSNHKPGIRILGQLLDASRTNQDDDNDYSNLLLQQAYVGDNNSLKEVEFMIRLTDKSKFYKLYIYAMSLDKELDTVPLAMTYLIQLDTNIDYDHLKGKKYGEFPQQTSQWKEDCRLIRPMNKILTLPSVNGDGKREEIFEVIIPQAMKVASVIDEEWFQFSESKEEESKWIGSMSLNSSMKSGSLLTIFANFNSRYNSYIPLLEYLIQ